MKPVYFFLGVDPAPSESQRSDHGALTTAAAVPRTEVLSDNPADWYVDFVHCRVLTHEHKASARQWSGLIHEQHQRFGYDKICMDYGSGGGGAYVQRELREPKQLIQGVETETTPIADLVEGPKRVVRAAFILNMFKRGDPGIELVWPDPVNSGKSLAGDELLKDAAFSSFKEGMDHVMMGWPAGREDLDEWRPEMEGRVEGKQPWPEERVHALRNLAAATVQLKNIAVATREDGLPLTTKRGARVFSSVGRDDIALSHILCWAAFLIWLRSDDWRQLTAPEDANGFLAW